MNKIEEQKLQEEFLKIQKSADFYGLDCFKTIFHVVDFETLHELAAYGGFPSRYPHYRWAVEYEKLNKQYRHGLMKIYEMVINTDPCHAYLLLANLPIDMKIVAAHVLGHNDFFKNNYCFGHTNRKMLDEIANHCARIECHISKHGQDKVEEFITQVFSLENLIDIHSPYIKRYGEPVKTEGGDDEEIIEIPTLKGPRRYLDRYLNPEEWKKEMKEIIEKKKEEEKEKKIGMKIPEEPERDILLFLLLNAPLQEWERDILSIIREEVYYFAPQGQTKIMNEGWATYWHSKIMSGGEDYQKDEPAPLATDPEIIDYAIHHSGTVASHGYLNPYKLGLAIWKDIEARWNKGKFGEEWEECLKKGGYEDRKKYDKKIGKGREKMFEVRKMHNDIAFLSEFLTDEMIAKQNLFHFQKYGDFYVIDSFKANKIKKQVLFQLTNFGDPIIKIEDANYKKQGELYLKHYWEGISLDLRWAKEVLLKSLALIWKRPVNIETVITEEKDLPAPKTHPEKPPEFPGFPEKIKGEVMILRCTPPGKDGKYDYNEKKNGEIVETKAII